MRIDYSKWYNTCERFVMLARDLEKCFNPDSSVTYKEKYGRFDITYWWVSEESQEFFDKAEEHSLVVCQRCCMEWKQHDIWECWWMYHLCTKCYIKYLFCKVLEKCWLRNKNKPL